MTSTIQEQRIIEIQKALRDGVLMAGCFMILEGATHLPIAI